MLLLSKKINIDSYAAFIKIINIYIYQSINQRAPYVDDAHFPTY